VDDVRMGFEKIEFFADSFFNDLTKIFELAQISSPISDHSVHLHAWELHRYRPLGKFVWEFIGLSLLAIQSSEGGLDRGEDIGLKEAVITALCVTLGIGFEVDIVIDFIVSIHIGRIHGFFPQHRYVILEIAYLSMWVVCNLQQVLIDAESFTILGENEIWISQIFIKAKIFHVWVVLRIATVANEVNENTVPGVFVHFEFLGLLECFGFLINFFKSCDNLCLGRVVDIFDRFDLNNLFEKIDSIIFAIICVRPLEFWEAVTFQPVTPKDDTALFYNLVVFNVLTQRLNHS
jgi:hypothetical protein